MLQCEECGHVFDENDLVHYEGGGCYESDYGVNGQFGSNNYYSYDYDGCPECESGEYIELEQCSNCGKYVSEYYDEENELCEKCAEDED